LVSGLAGILTLPQVVLPMCLNPRRSRRLTIRFRVWVGDLANRIPAKMC
jgi:hypothetical protein